MSVSFHFIIKFIITIRSSHDTFHIETSRLVFRKTSLKRQKALAETQDSLFYSAVTEHWTHLEDICVVNVVKMFKKKGNSSLKMWNVNLHSHTSSSVVSSGHWRHQLKAANTKLSIHFPERWRWRGRGRGRGRRDEWKRVSQSDQQRLCSLMSSCEDARLHDLLSRLAPANCSDWLHWNLHRYRWTSYYHACRTC